MAFANFWPGFGTGGAAKRDLSNLTAHPDSSKHTKVLQGDGTFVDQAVEFVDVPASATATGTAGQLAYDDDYFYVCTATDTWRRIPLSEW